MGYATVSTTRYTLVAEGIETDLDHHHKQRSNARAAELHADEELAEGEAKERVRQALRDHYADWFKPETSRDSLLEQARANYAI